jgi:FkbM family methyltransferase
MDIMERFSEIIRVDSPIVLELGACDGRHTDIMCRIIKQLGIQNYQFHSFEPSSELASQVLSRNASHFPNLRFVPSAIGNVDGTIEFHISSGTETRPDAYKQSFYGSSSIKAPDKCTEYWPDMKFRTVKCKCYRLDTYCEQAGIQKVDFIWSDIQGAERDMIEGGQKILSNTRYLYTEISGGNQYKDTGYENANDLIALLPGKWEMVEDYGDDVLLRNVSLT